MRGKEKHKGEKWSSAISVGIISFTEPIFLVSLQTSIPYLRHFIQRLKMS